MQMGLQEKYTADIKDAWIKTCKIVAEAMISDNYLRSSTNDDESEYYQDNDDLDARKIRLVQESWNFIQQIGLQEFAVQFFKRIFDAHPELLEYFSFESDWFRSDAYMVHTLKVATAIGKAVDNLEDLETLTPMLKILGYKHKKLGVKKEHYHIVINSLIDTLSEFLGDHFKNDVRKAWILVGNLVSESMISDHYDPKK